MMKKRYPSKIGLEILIPVLLILGFSFWPLQEDPNPYAIALLFLIVAFLTLVLFGNRYIIDGAVLIIQTAFTRQRINIGEITSIRPTRNPLAAPASSLDRLEILYGDGNSVLISPKGKTQFLQDLKTINPQIQILPI